MMHTSINGAKPTNTRYDGRARRNKVTYDGTASLATKFSPDTLITGGKAAVDVRRKVLRRITGWRTRSGTLFGSEGSDGSERDVNVKMVDVIRCVIVSARVPRARIFINPTVEVAGSHVHMASAVIGMAKTGGDLLGVIRRGGMLQ